MNNTTSRIKECGDVSREEMGVIKVLAKSGKYELVHKSAGYYIAGSCLRHDNESFGVRFFCEYSNAWHGRFFKTELEARDLFNRWHQRQ